MNDSWLANRASVPGFDDDTIIDVNALVSAIDYLRKLRVVVDGDPTRNDFDVADDLIDLTTAIRTLERSLAHARTRARRDKPNKTP